MNAEVMEIRQEEGMGITSRPIASRPTCSNFGSFSELLASAMEESPPYICYEPMVPAIRPKTLRLKPMPRCAEFNTIPPQEGAPSTDVCSFPRRTSGPENKPTVIYKPMAKPVSKTAVSLIENMDQHQLNVDRVTGHLQTTPVIESSIDPPWGASMAQASGHKQSEHVLSNADHRPSYDGYNWRKYGQKQVKGSEYPRSYYKCTHPNCPVKKKVERSLEGHIAEIVYKGEHSHPKPHQRRTLSGSRGRHAAPPADKSGEEPWNLGPSDEPLLLPCPVYPETTTPVVHPDHGFGTSDYSCCGPSEEFEEGTRGVNQVEEPRRKKRKTDLVKEGDTSGEMLQDARVVIQNSSAETEVFEDGFRWRKYGQKVVKGNPYPRSYYRCTYQKCKVRKHVERASDDPNAFITTYEGKHNHGTTERAVVKAAAAAADPGLDPGQHGFRSSSNNI